MAAPAAESWPRRTVASPPTGRKTKPFITKKCFAASPIDKRDTSPNLTGPYPLLGWVGSKAGAPPSLRVSGGGAGPCPAPAPVPGTRGPRSVVDGGGKLVTWPSRASYQLAPTGEPPTASEEELSGKSPTGSL